MDLVRCFFFRMPVKCDHLLRLLIDLSAEDGCVGYKNGFYCFHLIGVLVVCASYIK